MKAAGNVESEIKEVNFAAARYVKSCFKCTTTQFKLVDVDGVL